MQRYRFRNVPMFQTGTHGPPKYRPLMAFYPMAPDMDSRIQTTWVVFCSWTTLSSPSAFTYVLGISFPLLVFAETQPTFQDLHLCLDYLIPNATLSSFVLQPHCFDTSCLSWAWILTFVVIMLYIPSTSDDKPRKMGTVHGVLFCILRSSFLHKGPMNDI